VRLPPPGGSVFGIDSTSFGIDSTSFGIDSTSFVLGVAFLAFLAVVWFVIWLQEPSVRAARARENRQARRAVREAEKIVQRSSR
jgi:hypothetical protein